MKESELRRAVGYIRVSTAEQVEGESLNTQENELKKFAKFHGFEFVNMYADKGQSGAKIEHRKALQSMLKDSSQGKFDVLIFYKFSRLARNAREFQNIVHELNQNGVEVQCVKENIAPNTQTGKLMMNILSAFAEWEHETIREQTSVNRSAKWKDLRTFIGKPTFGYDVKNKKDLIVNERERKLYLEIVNMYVKKEMSYNDIVIELNSRGVKSKQGKRWTSAVLSRILKNPAYYGNLIVNQYKYEDSDRGAGTKRTKKLKPRSEWINYPIPALISKKEWDEVQKTREFRQHKSKRIGESTHEFYLRDVMYCNHCGGKIKHFIGKKRKDGVIPRYYGCYWSGRSKKTLESAGRVKCTLPYIPAKELETLVWMRLMLPFMGYPEKLIGKLFSDENFDRQIEETKETINSLTKDLEAVKRVKNNLYLLLKDPKLDINDLSEQLGKNNNELLTLTSYLEDATTKLEQLENKEQERIQGIEFIKNNKESFSILRKDLYSLDVDSRKTLVESLVTDKKILVDYGALEPYDGSVGPTVWHKMKFNVEIFQRFADEGKLPSLTKNHSNNGGRHQRGESPRNQGIHTILRKYDAFTWCQGANAANLDTDRSKVGKTAQNIGSHNNGFLIDKGTCSFQIR